MSARDVLKKLDAEATNGPWKLVRDSYKHWSGREIKTVDVEPLGLTDGETGDSLLDNGDASLIVALRNALPALIAYMEAADDLRIYPAHPDFLSRHAERCAAYDAAEAALARSLEGEK